MSVHLMDRVWHLVIKPGTRKLVTLAIADFCDDRGYCCPSVKVLAQKSCVSERLVQETLRWLESLQALVIVERERQRRTPLYHFRVQTLEGVCQKVVGERETAETAPLGITRNATVNNPRNSRGAHSAPLDNVTVNGVDRAEFGFPPDPPSSTTKHLGRQIALEGFPIEDQDTNKPGGAPSFPPPESSPFSPPEWWRPLEELPGYKRRNYRNAVDTIERACADNGVSPDVLVKSFASYYRLNRARNGWTDPVAALRRTLPREIAKLLKAATIPKTRAEREALSAEIRAGFGDVER